MTDQATVDEQNPSAEDLARAKRKDRLQIAGVVLGFISFIVAYDYWETGWYRSVTFTKPTMLYVNDHGDFIFMRDHPDGHIVVGPNTRAKVISMQTPDLVGYWVRLEDGKRWYWQFDDRDGALLERNPLNLFGLF